MHPSSSKGNLMGLPQRHRFSMETPPPLLRGNVHARTGAGPKHLVSGSSGSDGGARTGKNVPTLRQDLHASLARAGSPSFLAVGAEPVGVHEEAVRPRGAAPHELPELGILLAQ